MKTRWRREEPRNSIAKLVFQWSSTWCLHVFSHPSHNVKYKLAWDGNSVCHRAWCNLSRLFLFRESCWLQNCIANFVQQKPCEGKKFSLLYIVPTLCGSSQCINIHASFQLAIGLHQLTEKPARRKSQVQVYEKANRERQTSGEITIELSHRLEAVLGLVSSAARAVINCDLPRTHFCE